MAKDIQELRITVFPYFLPGHGVEEPKVILFRKPTKRWNPEGEGGERVVISGVVNAKVNGRDTNLKKPPRKLTSKRALKAATRAARREFEEETGISSRKYKLRFDYIGSLALPDGLAVNGVRHVFAVGIPRPKKRDMVDLSLEHTDWTVHSLSELKSFLGDPLNVPDKVRRQHYGDMVKLFLDHLVR